MLYHPLWPDLDIPHRIVQLASGGRPSNHEMMYLAEGAYNRAYLSGDWVIKTCKDYGSEGDCGTTWRSIQDEVMTLSEDWIALFSMVLAPTAVVDDSTVIQRKVSEVAYKVRDIKEDLDLCRTVDNAFYRLGLLDVHEGNWGIGEDGTLQVFDPMFDCRYPIIDDIFAKKVLAKPLKSEAMERLIVPVITLANEIYHKEMSERH